MSNLKKKKKKKKKEKKNLNLPQLCLLTKASFYSHLANGESSF